MTQREYFNSVAHMWDDMCRHDADKIKHIMKLADIHKGSTVLDAGSGTGIMIPYLHDAAGDDGIIHAVDVADKMLEISAKKHNYDNVEFICADVTKTNKSDFYDCIMCYSMFPHFENKAEAVKQLALMLKHGGKLVIAHSQSRDAINNLHKSSDEAVQEDNLPNAETINQYFTDSGLKTIVCVDNGEMYVLIGKKTKNSEKS